MSRWLIETRLRATGRQLRSLRAELAELAEQHFYLADEADDLHTRAVGSDSPFDEREFREARRHADVAGRRRGEIADAIARLERRQDELLDRLGRVG